MSTLSCVEMDSVLCPIIGNMAGVTVIITAVLEKTAVCSIAGDRSGRKMVVNKQKIEINHNKLKARCNETKSAFNSNF